MNYDEIHRFMTEYVNALDIEDGQYRIIFPFDKQGDRVYLFLPIYQKRDHILDLDGQKKQKRGE